MVRDLFEEKLLEALNGLREDIQALTGEVRLLREDQIATSNAEPSVADASSEEVNKTSILDMDKHLLCIRLVLLLHYYDMVRKEAKARGICLRGIGRNSVFSYLYYHYKLSDYNRIQTHGNNAQTRFEKNYENHIEGHFQYMLAPNPNLVSVLSQRKKVTKNLAAKVFMVDLETSSHCAAYAAFKECIKDVLL